MESFTSSVDQMFDIISTGSREWLVDTFAILESRACSFCSSVVTAVHFDPDWH